ncbi:procollagen galactosyltransferase 2 [Echinococcus multilocularis]|uniref:Procollagen galactosyltransferase 2 n=1 Tax=Echinococcus multilocularis TaxID=6211 RepID=A0A068Y5F9_ECHMU|nr:procollagen galactosyltransferase 2 [Echinococcus multilocularis]
MSRLLSYSFFFILIPKWVLSVAKSCPHSSSNFPEIEPSVSIGVLVRNKAHSLPYFLHHLEQLDYPKKRIHLNFRLDNTIDISARILERWVESVQDLYHGIDLDMDEVNLRPVSPNWAKDHHQHLVNLRQASIERAYELNADFFFNLDADAILLNNATLKRLVEASSIPSKEYPVPITVIAPMLNCTTSDVFSNFWGDITEEGYYKRSQDYFALQRRHKEGIFSVAMIHTAVLVNLRHTRKKRLAFKPLNSGYTGPIDDIIIFARNAQLQGIDFYLDNRVFYGYFPLPVDEAEIPLAYRYSAKYLLEREAEIFLHLRLNAAFDDALPKSFALKFSPKLEQFVKLPEPSLLGFDQIYLINLKRRPDRLEKMNYALREQGVKAKLVRATDGRELNPEIIKQWNITQLSGYADPYHKRALKYGEIGCFLSHYRIWQDMLVNDYERILILEDDLRFVPGFVRRLQATVKEADVTLPDWELLYVGRKRMSSNEVMVRGARFLAYPSYTYWTLAYVLRRSGAQKLMVQRPLEKMVAVDEFLPIMFDRHPNERWLAHFEPRNLLAISAEPLLVEPLRYTGEPFYVSDTEDSEIIPEFLYTEREEDIGVSEGDES